MAHQGVNRFSNALALLVSGRVLALRQIADTLIETGFVTGSRQGTTFPPHGSSADWMSQASFIVPNPAHLRETDFWPPSFAWFNFRVARRSRATAKGSVRAYELAEMVHRPRPSCQALRSNCCRRKAPTSSSAC